ncbi:TPA: SIS domain-containing protein [Streptococcus pyogenes]|uniref:SIS domain-containing protein n=1 Tax=Streptococcus pyogenes TaxID=1314 RepID=UPI000640B32A|nr:SIS domain-containing protein [Streptococcus pyogenes]HER4516126.1 SIS domain-containing protein [Streptococcus pyogenes NGAS743]HER4524874.1 SIS domain-containing protein [Streptococcus pyogenes NGAS747]HER4528284.1 SIS domain-containing protein [Streptococcus pyogenes NGAS739]HER4539803.1 SIS domain-containing protein [Streptococcus pyogenes NGAS668]HER4543225.1 SIS domain-containing protein [Streptococcus pyogenes NGAS669]HER4551896.1 SIS domain-containing protein [Streptococcus pyogene
MFKKSQEDLEALGAAITTKEIKQEPRLWQETMTFFEETRDSLDSFLKRVCESANGNNVHVIFTGAGTSEYIGNTICPYLKKVGNRQRYLFESVASTDLVAAPDYYLVEEETVLLVSFARSGNSPESVAAVNLVNQLVPNSYDLTITCAKDGELAKKAQQDERSYLYLMPEDANDAGFAMTGSFTCMMLAALLIFDDANSIAQKEAYVTDMILAGQAVIDQERRLQELADLGFERLVYLGSAGLAKLTQEAQLKMLELTAGQVATLYESSMGFRHGPKSFINDRTLVIGFVNNDAYVRQYDLDMLEEIQADGIALKTLALLQGGDINFSEDQFRLDTRHLLPDAYLAFPMILVAQTLALLTAVILGNSPDTPSATGTVNRVVKGVTIHPYPTSSRQCNKA